jgi:hypothetical protein
MKQKLLITTLLASAVAVALLSVWLLKHQPPVPGGRPPIGGHASQPKLKADAVRGQDSASPRSATSASNPHLIAQICGANGYGELQTLQDAGPLSTADCEALCRFLREKTTDETLERMASLKNSVMNILARQTNLPDPWETLLRQILEDENQHPVIRDYALQHLFSRYEELPDGPPRRELEALFWRMLQRTQGSFAGTALLGLYNLSVQGFGIDAVRLRQGALNLLQGPAAGPLSRISALQVCALSGERDALPAALRTAQQEETLALRCSAIAAIGALGTKRDLPALQAVRHEGNPSIRLAAQAAIKRIETKTNS